MPDPFTVGFGLFFAALKLRGDSDNPLVAKLSEIAADMSGHLAGHFAHEDVERAREGLYQFFSFQNPEKNRDLERAVTRSSVHADVYCLMEALHEPLDPPKGRVERWRRLLNERAPEILLGQPREGVLTSGMRATLRSVKEKRVETLRGLEAGFEFKAAEIESRLLVDMVRSKTYGEALAAAAFEKIESDSGALDGEVRGIFEQHWFAYLCGSFHHEIKHNQPVANIFITLSLDRIETAVRDEGEKTRDLIKQVWAAAPSGPRKIDPRFYLEALREECRHIDIRGLRVSGGSVYQFPIEELYTPLTTVLAHQREEKELGTSRAVPLQDGLRDRCVVLVGDPGAGKSTFLRRIAFAACEVLLGNNPEAASGLIPVKPCPLPLLIRAASLGEHIRKSKDGPADAHDPEWLVLYLAGAAQHSNWELDAEFFRERLREGCLLLVDGLDEVADRVRRKAVAKLLEQASRAYKKTRIVATSRPPAYGGETVITGFATVEIADLDEGAIETFVAKWCGALYPAEATAKEHRETLLKEIRSKPEIRRMAVNPVMLTALAALNWNQKKLPDQRSELYFSVLNWLAESREDAAGRSAVQCLQRMRRVAYVMHTDVKGKQVEISRHRAAEILAPEFREYAEPQEKLEAALAFLEKEEVDSGILISRGDVLRYWHLTFEEYLTAEMLAVRDGDRHRLLFDEGKLYRPEWRETALLLAGVLCKQDRERVDAFLAEMLDRLGDRASLPDRAKCVGLMGRILRDLKAWGYIISDPRYRENLDACLAIFEADRASDVPFESRLEAAEALGQAGDPRLDDDNWITIPAGTFRMGAQAVQPKDRNYDEEAHDNESPVHEVTLREFRIGRYPVTVQEFEAFIVDQGYAQRRCWSAGGFGEFEAPDRWEQQREHPNWPVTGVSWYEAAAYCAWTGGRLPTEAEWERAARGPGGGKYPWGDEPMDPSRANYTHANRVGHATPVGLYPRGSTAEGVSDMLGNVLEWCSDWDAGYQRSPQIDAKGPEHANGKALRGGCWGYMESYTRVSDRSASIPTGRRDFSGFRCAQGVC